jgi:hypothetical protein
VLRTRRTGASAFFGFSTRRGFDRTPIDVHCEWAMTTAALTRVPSSQIGLVGSLAFILLVVVSIIPH